MTASSKENLPRRRFASMLLLLVFVERASSFLPLTSPRILSTATSSSSSKSPFSSSVRSLRSTTNDSKEEQAETTTTSIASKEEEEESSKRTRLYQSLKRLQKDFLPSKAVNLYTSYAGRLWNETNPEARQLVAGNQTIRLVRQLQQVLRSNNENDRDILISVERRKEVMDACDHLLQDAAVVEVNETSVASLKESVSKVMVMQDNDSNGEATAKKKKKPRRSIMFGAIMGAIVAGWVFSGNYLFTGGFTLMTVLGQLEYYRMVMKTGVYPARRISVVGACSMFLTALFAPDLHQIVLPIFGLWSMIYFLTIKKTMTTIPEIATTFTGMFYLGYVPSFFVRLRILDIGTEQTRLASLAAPILDSIRAFFGDKLPYKVVQAIHLPVTSGAVFIFWTWLCLAFSDVGAYFVGRKFGKTKLSAISPAAGATSPNKSVEGVIGACAVSAGLAILGAWVQRWPCYVLTGALHGISLALLGLVGDLTASMLKRDAGLKDFGDLIPEHGGIMDRVDSFVWAAPYSWLVYLYVIPALKQWLR